MRIKEITQDVLFEVSAFFLILYLCLILSICKLAGVSLDDFEEEDAL